MRRWFLPETPDLLGLLAVQGEITIRGIDALSRVVEGRSVPGCLRPRH